MNNNPIKKEGVNAEQMGNEWMLYDTQEGAVHVINSTAAFIWQLCDGSNSIEDIKKELMQSYDVADDTELDKDIDKILNHFDELGVLQD